MSPKTLAAAAALMMLATGAHAQFNAAGLKWGPAPPVFPKGAQMAVLSGDPSKAGIFVLRLKLPAGYEIPAHHHPTDEFVTVMSGDFRLGMGDKLDKAKSATLTAGGFANAAAGMNHFGWSKAGAIVQVHAMGPFAMTYVNPKDNPVK